MNAQARANLKATTVLIDELARSGVREACLSPGSRSAPLALALAREARVRTHIVTDERAAAFFGLGLARETGRAVALVCTSGTAAVQYGPALTEAYHSAIPLIAITADRPPELRDCGAAQTIWQPGLFTHRVLWEADVATPSPGCDLEAYYRTLACRAVAVSTGRPRGPVHLNFCLREPLFEASGLQEEILASRAGGRAGQEPWLRIHRPPAPANPPASRRLAEIARANEKGLILCGPGAADSSTADSIAAFAWHFGWPIVADPLSGLRHGPHSRALVADAADLLLRSETANSALRPEFLLRLGGTPSSKPLQGLLHPGSLGRQWVLSPDERWNDPFFGAEEVIVGDTARILVDSIGEGSERRPSDWTTNWLEASHRARDAVEESLQESTEPFEGRIVRDALAAVPSGTLVVVGNSTPVRDIDTFAGGRPDIELVGNRGANGIDGLIASTLGAAAAAQRPILLLVGDISYLHDVSALQLAQQHELHATIVVINNDGGQIFSRLSQGTLPPRERAMFTTPHARRVTQLFPAAGIRFREIEEAHELGTEVTRSFTTPGLDVLEVFVAAQRSADLHGECIARSLKKFEAHAKGAT